MATWRTACTGRRATAPQPLIVYFHGGGWVLRSHDSDDPLFRDLCVRSDAVILSVNYRHAPEDRCPAAVVDGFAAVKWITGTPWSSVACPDSWLCADGAPVPTSSPSRG